ncbi:MAG: thiol:disulfide interchange protein [Aquificaceae bacterium]|nr:MAG: thiol:disulfide interchange protein [Aquificaceae bacterium]
MKKLLTLLFAFITSIAITSNSYAFGAENLLKPNKAFQVSIESNGPDFITATWEIADGYYMYRKRFSFSSNTADVTLGKPIFPEGELKDDPGFGKVTVYRKRVSIKIPVENPKNISLANIKTKSQGCADIGVCYPPQKVSVDVTLPQAIAKKITTSESITTIGALDTAASNPSDLAAQLGIPSLGKGKKSGGVLPPDEAFAFDINATDKQTLNAHWQITPGHYLYKNKIKFFVRDSNDITLGKLALPKGEKHHDEYFGDIVTYTKDFDIKLPLLGSTGADSVTIKTSYQGCSKITGICYPPQIKTQKIDLRSAQTAIQTVASTSPSSETSSSNSDDKVSEQDQFANILKDNNLFAILGLFFIAGLALTFTPCVFPMIPILSGIISGQGNDISKKKAFILSLAYVIPMALTYAIVGVLAGLSGESLTAALQTPWVIASFAILFVILAFAMFGFYELQMPSSIQNKLSSISNNQKGGTLLGAAIMGMLSALIVGPCVTAPLTGALIFIADTKDALLGGLSLFMLGIGMGVPLLIIGTAAGEFLPKAGAWMDKVKAVFGVLMLGLAIWMLERILPIEIIILLTAALLIGSAIYMKAIDPLDANNSGWDRLWKAVGIIILAYGLILIAGIAKGNKSFIYPLKDKVISQVSTSAAGGTIINATEGLVFSPIKGIKGLNLALDTAATQNKTVMLDFYADWCISCKEMEHKVFSDPRVVKALENTILIQADVTKNDDLDIALMKKFGLFGPPGILFFDTNKQEYRSFRVVGEMSADKFLAHINEFLSQKK